MAEMMDGLAGVLGWLLAAMAFAVVLAGLGLWAIWRRIRDLAVPAEAGFFATMHHIPITLPILLDLLDFGLDIFAAPVSWVVLDRLGLPGLRNKAAVEALIPFTQPIPTFTVGWLIARWGGVGQNEE